MSESSFSELTKLGIKFYEEKLKAILEPEHNGEFVAIEPYLGKFTIDKDEMQVISKARNEMPGKIFCLLRVGSEFTHKIGGTWLKKRVL